MLRIAKVEDFIEREQTARRKRLQMNADEALALISIVARADIGDAYDKKGKLLPIHQWPDSLRLAVKGIKPGPFGDTIVLNDRLKALELLLTAEGRLRNKVDLSHSVEDVVALLAAKTPA
jgi:hypothetical protein